MDGNEILLLGLGIQSSWQLVDQRLDVDKQPHELHLTERSDRGKKYTCPVCGAHCAAHDFQETDKRLWRIVEYYVAKAVAAFDLSAVKAIVMFDSAESRSQRTLAADAVIEIPARNQTANVVMSILLIDMRFSDGLSG